MLLVSSTFTMNPSVYRNLPFDTVNDLAPVTMLMWQPFMLSVHPSLPVRTVKDLIAILMTRPDDLSPQYLV